MLDELFASSIAGNFPLSREWSEHLLMKLKHQMLQQAELIVEEDYETAKDQVQQMQVHFGCQRVLSTQCHLACLTVHQTGLNQQQWQATQDYDAKFVDTDYILVSSPLLGNQ